MYKLVYDSENYSLFELLIALGKVVMVFMANYEGMFVYIKMWKKMKAYFIFM
jgi:hypothetical protein